MLLAGLPMPPGSANPWSRSGDVNAPMEVFVLDDQIAEIDANTKIEPEFTRYLVRCRITART